MEESERACRHRVLLGEIRAFFWHHKRRYGARRIMEELSSQGIAWRESPG